MSDEQRIMAKNLSMPCLNELFTITHVVDKHGHKRNPSFFDKSNSHHLDTSGWDQGELKVIHYKGVY